MASSISIVDCPLTTSSLNINPCVPKDIFPMAGYLVLRLNAFFAFCSAQAYFGTPPGGFRPVGPGYTKGAYPQDFDIVGRELEAVDWTVS
jgi:hypothetical protein